MSIEFQRGTKRTNYLTEKIVHGEIELHLDGIGYFSDIDDYDLTVSIKVNANSPDTKDDLVICPDSAIAWFTDTEMTLIRKSCTTLTEKKDVKKIIYLCEYDWHCNPKQDLIALYQEDKLESNFLKFYFGYMVRYKGRKVPLDTLYATDPKAKGFKDRIERYQD